jgi:hypothetical protein
MTKVELRAIDPLCGLPWRIGEGLDTESGKLVMQLSPAYLKWLEESLQKGCQEEG